MGLCAVPLRALGMARQSLGVGARTPNRAARLCARIGRLHRRFQFFGVRGVRQRSGGRLGAPRLAGAVSPLVPRKPRLRAKRERHARHQCDQHHQQRHQRPAREPERAFGCHGRLARELRRGAPCGPGSAAGGCQDARSGAGDARRPSRHAGPEELCQSGAGGAAACSSQDPRDRCGQHAASACASGHPRSPGRCAQRPPRRKRRASARAGDQSRRARESAASGGLAAPRRARAASAIPNAAGYAGTVQSWTRRGRAQRAQP